MVLGGHGLCHPHMNPILGLTVGNSIMVPRLKQEEWGSRFVSFALAYLSVCDSPFLDQASKGGLPLRVLKRERSTTNYGLCSPHCVLALSACL